MARVWAAEWPLQGVEGGGARGGAMLVSESVVRVWAGRITALRGELKAGGPSPAS